jgi:4-amino-4-deoxy-L-arabinose transferase-like glycosyltransferase
VRRLSEFHQGVPRAIRIALIAAIVLYAGLLRLDAISAKYGPVSSPRWLQRLQESRLGDSVLRPASVKWQPEPVFPHADGVPTRYRSDPYTYLQYAREMRAFYAAHRREPLFPFATKISLAVLHDQDVAVSFASAAFSLLAVFATWLLGAEAFSFAVGAGAALLFAIEYDVVYWSTGGWRDDAFTFTVVAAAWAMLRCMRSPTGRNAVVLGVFAGAACLVRITAVSFIIPGLAYLLLAAPATRRQRVTTIALATITAAIVVGPYVVNCWRTFGDPLYAINVHADVYRASEGQDMRNSETASQYLGAGARLRPFRTLDTFVLGMTEYPFTNKWTGFEPWIHSAGRWLAVAAVIGLVLFTATREGGLLLVVLAGSLVPFAFTWRLVSDWRFTEHAYPFLLIAACVTAATVARALQPSSIRRVRTFRPSTPSIVRWVSVVAAIAVTSVLVARVFPVLIFEETLRSGEPALIMAGVRDAVFFRGDWSEVRGANLNTRVTGDPRPVIRVPLPAAADYDAVVRLDSERVSILVNGHFVARCDPGAPAGSMGICRFRMPSGASRSGFNQVAFVPEQQRPLRVWYMRVQRAGSG